MLRGRCIGSPPWLDLKSNQGLALIPSLIILVVLTLVVFVALKESIWGLTSAFHRKEKVSLDLVAKSALEIVQSRLKDRMNPPRLKPNGSDWTIDDLKYQVPVGLDETRCPTQCWCNGPTCYHGYRFQQATNVEARLTQYNDDFLYEEQKQIGIFEPCTLTNGKCPESAQWKVSLVRSNQIPMGSVDLRSDQIADTGYQYDLEVIATDAKKGNRAVIRSDLLLLSLKPSTDSVFAFHANVISRMSLFSGYIKGAIAQYLDPDLLPKSASGTPITTPYWNFGEMGMLHYSCKSYGGFVAMAPCSVALASNEKPDYERKEYFTNMKAKGLITDIGGGSLLAPHSDASPAAQPVGLTIDDNDSTTGDTNKTPPDALTDQDPIAMIFNSTVMGRDRYGGIPDSSVDPLSSVLNPTADAQLRATGNCIYESNGATNGGLQIGIDGINALADKHSTKSVVLAPNAGCNITAKGTYIVHGDLIIAGDGAGLFQAPGGGTMKATLFATGNVYILNNVKTLNGPVETDYQNPTWKASVANAVTPFDQLGILANGHIIIGNLANSNNYAHAMTYANSEIPYFNLDFNGDNHMDLLVPDGLRPTTVSPRPAGITNFQVRRDSCANQLTYFAPDLSCDSQLPGLLPEGSTQIDDTHKYKFAFTESTAGSTKPGYGYVPNGGAGNYSWDGTTVRTGVSEAAYQSNPVVGSVNSDLFEGGWISTSRFRDFANAPILADNGHKHDSLDPQYINQAHYIGAKLYAGGVIIGLTSFDDKFTLPSAAVANPDNPFRAQQNFTGYNSAGWSFHLLKDVNNTTRYPRRCLSSAANIPYVPNNLYTNPGASSPPYIVGVSSPPRPTGIDIFGGVFARYVNITSTNGLCIYGDDRAMDLGHEPILVIPGPSSHEDPINAGL